MLETVMRVILSYKRRMVRKVKRRAPGSRFKSRLYYRTHKAKIRLQRRRYTKRNKIFLKTRKMFKRTRPSWLHPKKQKSFTPKMKKHPVKKQHPAYKPKAIKTHKPKPPKKSPAFKKPRMPKFHAPKRRKK